MKFQKAREVPWQGGISWLCLWSWACCIFAVIFLALHLELISPVLTWKGCGLFLQHSQCLFLFQCWTTDKSPGQARSVFQDIPWSSLCYWSAVLPGQGCVAAVSETSQATFVCQKHTSHFLGTHFWVWHMGINCFPTQYLLGCKGFQASFSSSLHLKKINDCHIGLCSLQIALYQKSIHKNLKEVCFIRYLPINVVCVYFYIWRICSWYKETLSVSWAVQHLSEVGLNILKHYLNRIKNLRNKICCKLPIVASHTLACLFFKHHFIICTKP